MADRAVVSVELADALEAVIRRSGQQPGGTPVGPRARPAPEADGRALADAYHELLAERERHRLPPPAAPAPRRWPWLIAGVVGIAVMGVWTWQSRALAKAAAPIVVSPDERKQELELATVANAIAKYVREEGSLPAVLQAARIEVQGVGYEIRGPRSFVLASERQGQRMEATVQVPDSGPLVFAFVRPRR